MKNMYIYIYIYIYILLLIKKTRKISKRKTHWLMAGETAARQNRDKLGVNWLSVKKRP